MEASNQIPQLRYVLLFVILLLLQVIVCNNLLLFGVAVPFIFIYFIICLPLDVNLNVLMLSSFLLGFSVDIFSDTMGLNSMACLLLSVCKKPVFYAYLPKEDKFKNACPGIASMGWINYIKYLLTISAIFSLIVFGLEFFSFASFFRILAMTISSAILTVILLIGIDAIFGNK